VSTATDMSERAVERGCGGRAAACARIVVAVALLAGSVVATPAWAQTAEELGTTVAVGFGRGADPLSWTLVEVTSSPRVPIAGQLEVRVTGGAGQGTVTRDLEVAAGATKVLHLLLPPAEQVQATFVPADGGDRVALRIEQARQRTSVLVGALGDTVRLPDPLSTAGTDRPVRQVPVDPAVLALGARALDALDALLVDQPTLAALTDAERADLEAAVTSGLDLLVTVASPAEPLALRWQPLEVDDGGAGLAAAADGWVLTRAVVFGGDADDEVIGAALAAGRGRVVALDAATVADGAGSLWRALLQPRPEAERMLVNGQDGDVGARLFGGVTSLPGVRGAALFLLAFLVLVGPVNALVVRRLGRRELSWVTIPAIALVFTGVAAVTTTGGGTEPSPVLRAAWWSDGVGHELTVVGVQAPGRGLQQITFPGARDALFHQPWGSSAGRSERVGDATVLAAPFEALQAATAIAYGTPDDDPPLAVTATVDGADDPATDGPAGLTVEVTNTTGVSFDDVRLRIATREVEVGALAGGDTVTLTVDDLGPHLAAGRPGGPDFRMLQDRRPAGGLGPQAADRLLAWGPLDGSPGTVWVTAHTTDDLGLATPQVAGGVDDRGSFVAVGVTPRIHERTAVAPHLIRRDLLRSTQDWMPWRPEPLTIDQQDEVVLRFRVPAALSGAPLVSSLDRGGEVMQGGVVDPWNDGCFAVTIYDADGEVLDEIDERCGADVACPPGANECAGDDRRTEARFPDGRSQVAIRTDDVAFEEPVEGFEVYDHLDERWVPARDVFGPGSDTARVVSPVGDVLVRARQVSWFEFAQRGLATSGKRGDT
jgi:hypothetical protein